MTLTDAINHLKESLADPTHKWGCEECKAEHEQLLEWLEDYKRLKDEMIPAYDEQLTEAQCKVIQQMREMKQLKADYIDLDRQLRDANSRADARWISCDDKLPPRGEAVFVAIYGTDVIFPQKGESILDAIERTQTEVRSSAIGFFGSDGWYDSDGFPMIVAPRYWFPIPDHPPTNPQPPKEG